MADDESKDTDGGNVVDMKGAKAPPMRAEVARYAAYFHKPVAVQLRQPYVAIEATYEDDGGEMKGVIAEGVGWPQIGRVPNAQTPDGQPFVPEPVVVLIGSLAASSDGQSLVFKRRTTMSGSLAEILMDPRDVYSCTVIVIVAEAPRPSRIVAPH